MATNKDSLIVSMQQAMRGESAGFYAFFNGTVQYVYRSASFLCANEEEAKRFVIDFYPYLYLKFPTFGNGADLTKWISANLVARFSAKYGSNTEPIKKDTLPLSLSNAQIDEIREEIKKRMHFPESEKAKTTTKKKSKNTPIIILVALTIVIFIVLVLYHYFPIFTGLNENNNDSPAPVLEQDNPLKVDEDLSSKSLEEALDELVLEYSDELTNESDTDETSSSNPKKENSSKNETSKKETEIPLSTNTTITTDIPKDLSLDIEDVDMSIPEVDMSIPPLEITN